MDMEDRQCHDDACQCNGGEEKDHCTHCRTCLPKSELQETDKGLCCETFNCSKKS